MCFSTPLGKFTYNTGAWYIHETLALQQVPGEHTHCIYMIKKKMLCLLWQRVTRKTDQSWPCYTCTVWLTYARSWVHSNIHLGRSLWTGPTFRLSPCKQTSQGFDFQVRARDFLLGRWVRPSHRRGALHCLAKLQSRFRSSEMPLNFALCSLNEEMLFRPDEAAVTAAHSVYKPAAAFCFITAKSYLWLPPPRSSQRGCRLVLKYPVCQI